MLQERLVNELSDVIWSQQQQLDALKIALQQLEKKLGGDPGLVDATQDEKPPHY